MWAHEFVLASQAVSYMTCSSYLDDFVMEAVQLLFRVVFSFFCSVMFKAMYCGIIVTEFEPQLHYYVHFRANTLGKCMNPLILPAMG